MNSVKLQNLLCLYILTMNCQKKKFKRNLIYNSITKENADIARCMYTIVEGEKQTKLFEKN